MLGVIDRDWYCSANRFKDGICNLCKNGGLATFYCDKSCSCYHRKYPTPAQFLQEYGKEYPYNNPVWYLAAHEIDNHPIEYRWHLSTLERTESFLNLLAKYTICICTPFPKPDDPPADWRPE